MIFDLTILAADGEFSVIDVEGDGGRDQQPVEISILRYSGGQPIDEFHWLINPERPITEFISNLHGITNEMVVDAPTFDDIRQDVTAQLSGRCIVGHNIKDDFRLLAPVMPEGLLLPRLMVDTLRLARNVVKEIPNHNLSSLAEALHIQVPEEKPYPVHTSWPLRGKARHSSGLDAFLTGQALVLMAARIDQNPRQIRHISQASLNLLSPKQESALREQLAELQSSSVVGGSSPSV